MSLGTVMQTQAARRAAVAVAILIWGVIVSPFPRSLHGAGMVLMLGLLAVDVLLGIRTGWLAFARSQSLDERQAALRDRAYRIAFRLVLLGVIALIGSAVIGSIAAEHTVAQPSPILGARWVVGLLQLLVALPTMVIAWLQQDPDEDADPRTQWSPVALRRWAPLLVIPAIAAVWLFTVGALPARASAVRDDAKYGLLTVTNASCGHFSAANEVGYGFGAVVRLNAEVCWDGTHAWVFREDPVSNMTSCSVDDGASDFALVVSQTCAERIDADGTMHYTVHGRVSAAIQHVASRDLLIRLDVTRDGQVLAFG